MTSRFRQAACVAIAVLSCAPLTSAKGESSEADNAALAASFPESKVDLEVGLTTIERDGKPISAKFEIEEGKLQLSVYIVRSDGFSEAVIDPKTGATASSEKIREADDLAAAAAQNAAMEKATVSLATATGTSVKANPGYRAISITSKLVGGHPWAEVTLIRDSAFRTVTEKLD